MNNRSQVLLTGIMMAIMIFIVAVILIRPIKDVITDARSEENLNCSSTDLSTGTEMTCILVNLYLFYFFGIAVAASLSYLLWRKLTSIPQY